MVAQYRYSRSPDQPYATEMLPLTADEREALRREAQAAFNQLFPAVQAAVQAGGDGESVNVAHRSSSAKSICMWTSSVLFGSLEEVAALYMDSDGHVPLVVDAARSRRLYELEAPSKERALHAVALRWSLWKPPSALSVGRDLCCLEYMDSFVDTESGRRAWARATKSVNHLCCPASQHPEGPVRTKLRVSGLILRETEQPGVLEHVAFVHVDARGAPAWVVQQAVAASKRSAESLNQVLKIMRQLRPQQAVGGGSASVDSALDDRTRDCRSCREHISKWTRAKRCRFCDAVLCRRCVDVSYHRADASGKNYRMCLPCSMYTGAVAKSGGHRGPPRAQSSRSNSRGTRERGATVASSAVHQERRLSASTLSALGKQTSLPGLSLPAGACSDGQRPSASTRSAGTESAGSSSREDAAAVAVADRLEHMQLQQAQSPSGSLQSSRSASSAHSGGGGESQSRSRRESLAVALELEPPRPKPVDLSYLSELVTPRAAATRDVDI